MPIHDWSKPEPCPECGAAGRLIGSAAKPGPGPKSARYECTKCGQRYGRSTE